MTRLVLIRHGHVEGIEPERFRGREDVSLSEVGRAQAEATASRVAGYWRPGVFYCSPSKRCVQTAEIIARQVNLAARSLDGLNDLDYGDWTWKTHEEARARDGALYARWFSRPDMVRFPNGESLQDLVARVAEALREIADRHLLETVLVVTHESVLRAMLLQLLQQPLSAYWRLAQSPCGISEVSLDHTDSHVLRVNETGHLEQNERTVSRPFSRS